MTSKDLLGRDDWDTRISEWLREASQNRKKAEVLIRGAEELEKMAEAGRVIQAGTAKRSGRRGGRKPKPAAEASEPATRTIRQTRRPKTETWTAVLMKVVAEYPEGVSYADLRARIMQTSLGPVLEKTDKAFYGGLLKMEKAGLLHRAGGYAYTPQAFLRVKAKIARGEMAELPKMPSPNHSPISEAITSYLEGRPRGARSGEIVIHLMAQKQSFAKSIQRNPTGAYNVLARMTRAGQLKKDEIEKIYWLPKKQEAQTKSGSPVGEPDRSEGSHPSLNGSKPLNERLL